MPRKSAPAPEPVPALAVATDTPTTKTRAPARTLRVRVAEISDHHLAALDMVGEKRPEFYDEVRKALDASDALDREQAALVSAHNAVVHAEQRVSDAQVLRNQTKSAMATLDAKAALVAKLHDDVPEADDIEAGPTT